MQLYQSLMTIRRYDVSMTIAQGSPLYSHVEAVLANEITDGYLKAGDQLPTEDSLIERFEVSRTLSRHIS